MLALRAANLNRGHFWNLFPKLNALHKYTTASPVLIEGFRMLVFLEFVISDLSQGPTVLDPLSVR